LKVHWLIPLTVDKVFQFTSKNELARSFCALGHEMSTTVAYNKEKIPLDGFSQVEYVKMRSGSFFDVLKFHLRMILSIWRTDADVVLLGFPTAHLLLPGRLSRLGRKRPLFVLDIRTIPVDISEGIRGVLEKLRFRFGVWLSNIFCDGITVITEALGEYIRKMIPRLLNRMGVWTSGVQLEHFSRKGPDMRAYLGLENKKILFYHGVLSPNRGLQNAMLAVGLLKEKMPDLFFLLVGEGEGRCELENLAAELGLKDSVKFTGKVPYREICSYIRTADCGILPFPGISWWEVSSPIKLMEYLAAGIPIVATDIKAHRRVMEKTGGIRLAENNQAGTLARCISEAMTVPTNPVELGVLEDNISWNSQAEKLTSFLTRLATMETK
jgi:glycosyltransferase involved in cell wall biosynthesis